MWIIGLSRKITVSTPARNTRFSFTLGGGAEAGDPVIAASGFFIGNGSGFFAAKTGTVPESGASLGSLESRPAMDGNWAGIPYNRLEVRSRERLAAFRSCSCFVPFR